MKEHNGHHTYKGKKVLLVDDDTDLLIQIKAQLEQMEFEVLTAESQAEAEKLLDKKFDLAIIDLMLEYLDSGFILCYKLKKKTPDLPIIIITSASTDTGLHFDATTEESKMWVNADSILDKEIRFEQLEREIDHLMLKKG